MPMPNLTPEGVVGTFVAIGSALGLGNWLVKREENKGNSNRRHADELGALRQELRQEIAALRVQIATLTEQLTQTREEMHIIKLSYAVFREKVKILIRLFRAGHADWQVLADDIEGEEHEVDALLDLPHAHPFAAVMPPMPEKKRILFVDDEEAIREIMHIVLGAHGYDVTCAKDAVTALKLVEQGKVFDLVIADLSMPNMSGEEMLKLLPMLGSKAKLVAYAGVSLDDGREIEKTLGVPVWRKPLDPNEIIRRIKEMLA